MGLMDTPTDLEDGKLQNNHYGGIFEFEEMNLQLVENFRFQELMLSDSLQKILRLYSYGNIPKYLTLNSDKYIFYSTLFGFLDLNKGTWITLSDFLETHFEVAIDFNPSRIYDLEIAENSFRFVFHKKNQPGLFVTSYEKDIGVTTKELYHPEIVCDFLKIIGDEIWIIRKVDQNKILLIKKYQL